MAREPPPLHAWLMLAAAVLAVSSAGPVFQLIDEVQPLLRASWRLQLTAVFLAPLAVWQYRGMDEQARKRTRTPKVTGIIVGSGLCLWIHFGSWVWSLDHTSLTHSLLFVTAHPLVFVAGLWLLKRPTNRQQTLGAVLGFLGAAVVLMGISSEGEVTLAGDAAAFLGAVAIVGYLTAGRVLREWMPLFVYAFPVTLIAAVMLALSAVWLEGAAWGAMPAASAVLGWSSLVWLPYIAYLALGPGIVGHTGINAVLRWFPPLVISVAVVLEPLIGSLLGWGLGTTDVPGMWTWLGGPLLIAGVLLVSMGLDELNTDARAATSEE